LYNINIITYLFAVAGRGRGLIEEKNGERHEKKNSRTDPTDPKMLGR